MIYRKSHRQVVPASCAALYPAHPALCHSWSPPQVCAPQDFYANLALVTESGIVELRMLPRPPNMAIGLCLPNLAKCCSMDIGPSGAI